VAAETNRRRRSSQWTAAFAVRRTLQPIPGTTTTRCLSEATVVPPFTPVTLELDRVTTPQENDDSAGLCGLGRVSPH